ncbi:caspase domain-containing protein [Cryptosporangium sp. NPDC051539]|uniref:caspase domain-containing protein n=1 Tax=Cryptosporangium sp. NPDC051539 TaxID=3363962 RepID=UPI0037A041F2
MARRALLIGAQTFGLQGVEHDVPAMAAALDARGFTDVRSCEWGDATRDGILAAYEKLIADTAADDTALVYYSGHGDYFAPLPEESVAVTRNDRQFIVPTDFTEDGDFRGITGIELSVLLGRLTERTGNAVVVLDCCHSALMSRNLGDLHVRQRPSTAGLDYEVIAAHLRRLVADGLQVGLARSTGNQNAVRLVACGQDQGAYERPRHDGPGWYGVFTRALVTTLQEASDVRVSWSTLMARVRAQVQRRGSVQRPEVEGPSSRALFEVGDAEFPGSLPVIPARGGRARIDAAPLFGVQVGDEFEVESDSGEQLATIRVDECDLTSASGPLSPPTELPAGARAHRTSAAARRVPVRMPPPVAAAAASSMFARPADPEEDAAFEVELTDDELTLRDRIGPLHAHLRSDPDAIRRTVGDLDRVARATLLRELRDESTATYPVTVEWGRVVGDQTHPLPLIGASLGVGDLVYLAVRNNGDVPLHVSVVDIGLSYALTQLTEEAPSGVRLDSGRSYDYGWNDGARRWEGFPLEWPLGLGTESPRPETVLVLVTRRPHDVTALRQQGVGSRDLRRPSPSDGSRSGLLVESVEFVLSPQGAPE